MQTTSHRPALRLLVGGTALALLAACAEPFDADLRDMGNGFDTTAAAMNPPDRPRPDDRGVISYPNYQVVVARDGDTLADVAARVGVDAGALARYNGVQPDARLRRDEIVALPGRVSEPSPATGAPSTGPILPNGTGTPGVSTQRIDVTSLAGAAINRAGTQTTTPTAVPTPAPTTPAASTIASSTPSSAPARQTGTEPVRHQVRRGETAYSVSRLYSVPVRSLAEWNGLGPELTIREGQFLLIPPTGAAQPVSAPVSQPGAGSPTPTPPSAAQPLPDEAPAAAAPAAPATPPAPVADMASQQTAPAKDAPLSMPAQGNIIRAYSKGRNDGIDIGAPAGSPVKAAASGTVAAITTNTDGIQIVVIRHEDGLLTVYTHVVDLTVARGASVSKGQTIGKVKAGDPSLLHFEVRRGMDSQDPTDFLP